MRGFRPALVAALLAVLAAGCSSNPPKDDTGPHGHPTQAAKGKAAHKKKEALLSRKAADRQARALYDKAREQIGNGDFSRADKTIGRLEIQFPFTEYATQGQILHAYALYRNQNPDEAAAETDRFLREHPRDPGAAYMVYLRGLIDMGRDDTLAKYLPLSTSGHDAGNKRTAFADFAMLLQRYPDSVYAADARRRMIWLRNRIADHELAIARYYYSRGAWLAAARRAEGVVSGYPGAPEQLQALRLMERCYGKLGLKDQQQQAAQLIAANQTSVKVAKKVAAAKAEANAPGFFGRIFDFLVKL
jgi:outer membrane assembly lipoprotein YfiO